MNAKQLRNTVFLLIFLITLQLEATLRPSESHLWGEAQLKWFGLSIYKARLWVIDGPLYQSDMLLEITYDRSLSAESIVEQSVQELKRQKINETLLSKWALTLKNIIPHVERGDQISAFYSPQKGLTFYHNQNKKLGQIEDDFFARSFLDIWLGEKTSQPELRRQLLKGGL